MQLHAAPEWLWRSLVSQLVAEGWTVEQARGAAQRFKEVPRAARSAVPNTLKKGNQAPDAQMCASGISQTNSA